jgi:hypothetical protein
VRQVADETLRNRWENEEDLTSSLASGDVKSRVRGARLIEFLHSDAKYRLMIGAMDDPAAEVRVAATRVMAKSLTSRRVVERLAQAVTGDASAEVRAAAAVALTEARNVTTAREALTRASGDADTKVAAAARGALAK